MSHGFVSHVGVIILIFKNDYSFFPSQLTVVLFHVRLSCAATC